MPTYSCAVNTPGSNSLYPYPYALAEVRAGANAPCLMLEFLAFQIGSSAGRVGLARVTALGDPQTNNTFPFIPESHANAPVAYATMIVAYGPVAIDPRINSFITGPPYYTSKQSLATLNNSIRGQTTIGGTGAPVIWSWPRGLHIPAGGAVIFYGIGGTTSYHASAVISE